MMTKYQIVVVKLETIVHNISKSTEDKKKQRIKRAFCRFADNVRREKERRDNKQKLVCLLWENKLGAMCSALERYTVQHKLHGSFALLKAHGEVARNASLAEEEEKAALDGLTTQI